MYFARPPQLPLEHGPSRAAQHPHSALKLLTLRALAVRCTAARKGAHRASRAASVPVRATRAMAAGTPTGSKRALGAATTPITEAAGAEAAGAGTTSTTRIKRAKRPERTPTDDAAIHAAIARDERVEPWRVRGALALLAAGDTLPFVARYRKEAHGALDEGQLRRIHTNWERAVELEQRREAVLAALRGMPPGPLRPDPATLAQLTAAVEAATTKADLEELYAPYKCVRCLPPFSPLVGVGVFLQRVGRSIAGGSAHSVATAHGRPCRLSNPPPPPPLAFAVFRRPAPRQLRTLLSGGPRCATGRSGRHARPWRVRRGCNLWLTCCGSGAPAREARRAARAVASGTRRNGSWTAPPCRPSTTRWLAHATSSQVSICVR